ncbi:MAG: prepilin-type cleavage/methylation domain-containing protein [Dictyoglomus sp. NZ13-RE01]|nr:MAG: prepilin-type cleavage/methylation domain-containing protein [Dictyoglomus sp. NZ13-RE01]
MRDGFTLLEVLVVILILGILSAIALPLYFDAIHQAKRNAQLHNMKLIKEGLEIYKLKYKTYSQDAWAFTTYFLYNSEYFSETLICPYNNKPYQAIQWQPSYTNWDDIWNWVEASNNYQNIYYKLEESGNYALTYYSR